VACGPFCNLGGQSLEYVTLAAQIGCDAPATAGRRALVEPATVSRRAVGPTDTAAAPDICCVGSPMIGDMIAADDGRLEAVP
jgi:hypothetical protein